MTPAPTKVILLIETSSSYGRQLLAGISQFARLHGPWSFYLEPSGLDAAPPTLEGWGAQGLIARIHTTQQAEAVARMKLPTVNLDFSTPDLFPRRVCNDDLKIGTLAARHLLDCGLENFGFCGWVPLDPSAEFWEQPRWEGFEQTLKSTRFKVARYQWPAKKTDRAWAREQQHLIQWLKELPRPVGIMASDDQRGRHILVAAQAAGLRVPHDVAVIGVDDDQLLCELCDPPLSSVGLHVDKIGFEAARLLDRMMKGQQASNDTQMIAPAGVVARQSTDVLTLADEQIASAIRHLRDNACRPIRISDVLRAVPMSRKTLELGCRRALGRTPHAELQRIRIDQVKHLLLNTDWPLKRISSATGFTYAEHMHSVFRRLVGLTPKQYRVSRRGMSTTVT